MSTANQQRPDNMTITPLSAISAIPAGTSLEAIEICLQKIDPAPSAFGQGTKQGSFAQDAAGGKATVQFIDFDPITPDWVGPWMRIEAGRNGKGDFTGIEVDEYNGKKRLRIRGGVNNDGSPKAVLKWLDGIPAAPASAPTRQAPPPQQARHSGPPHRDDIVYDNHPGQHHAAPPPRPQAGPPPRQQQAATPPARQPMPPARPPMPAGPHGATVGMAVKEAFSALVRGVRPEGIVDELRNPLFWGDVYQAASELLHLCKTLESGEIAPSIAKAEPPDFPAEEVVAQNEPWPEDA